MRQLLRNVQARLERRPQASTHPRHGELALLIERMDHLHDRGSAELERAAVTLRGALASLTAPPHTWADLSKQQRLTLRSALRALSALLDHVELGDSACRLDTAELSMAFRVVEMGTLVQRTCRPFEELAAERRIRLQMSITAPSGTASHAEMDEPKMQRVVLNLLFQAIKFTPVAGHIDVKLELDEVDDEFIFSVDDDGPPVPREQREEIFDRARQLDRSISSRTSETGMNLGTARDLVALHGGLLHLVPSRLGGACFRAHLPRHAPHGVRVGLGRDIDEHLPEKTADLARAELKEEAAIEASLPEPGRRPLVLIVEDSLSVQRVLTQTLRSECATISALSGEEGWRRAQEFGPDLILTDVSLPGMDARSLTRAVRNHPELEDVPILALSAANDTASPAELWEAGVRDVLRKPFLPQEVRARVRNLLATKRTLDLLNAVALRHETDPVKAADDVSRHQRELRAALEQVEVARNLAEHASKTKSNFLRMMSHELRTPVTAMQLRIHLLRQDAEVAASPRLRESLSRIHNASQRLVQLVNTTLEWARVESNRVTLQIEEIDLPALARETMDSLAEQARRRQLELIYEETNEGPPLPLRSDRRLVSLVALHLLSRAIQTTEQGSVHVRVGFDGENHQLTVRDRAPRLTSRMVEELFEPLRSAEDLRWQGGAGSGLGLFVVRDLARAVHAEITLEPWDHQGNAFTVRFPSLSASKSDGGPGLEASLTRDRLGALPGSGS